MFETLSDRFRDSVKRLSGRGRISEENVQDELRQIRIGLLEADVALPVVKEFIARVKEKALGQEVLGSLSPGQALIKIVHDELTRILGGDTAELELRATPPVVILLAGLQGAGKTTTAGKLARYLRERKSKSVLLASVDVYRPAAIEQLATLAGQVGVEVFPTDARARPVAIAKQALADARRRQSDVLIIDTAGRTAVDDAMMEEVSKIQAAIHPTETLFVVDAMTGQDAAATAAAFGKALELTGVILTKTDSDARGGAALSVKHVTGRSIKFVGSGEKSEALEAFHPERAAGRILGMGDVVSLVEEVQQKVDQKEAEKLARKVARGRKFDLADFRSQLQQMDKMGGLDSLIDKLPSMGPMADQVRAKLDNRETARMIAMIDSMTQQERRFPDLLQKGSRKRRVARGSGTQIQDVNRLLKQFNQAQRAMRKFSGKKMQKMMKRLEGQAPSGKLPPEMLKPRR